MLQSVAVLYHPRRKRAIEEAEWLQVALQERGVHTALGSGWDTQVVANLCCDRNLAVALGGDGTIIHIARLAAPLGVPVVGVNLGRVGFLAELTPQDLHAKVDALAEGQFWIEQRAMLDVTWRSGDGVERFLSLNEVAVARGGKPHAVHVETHLDGEPFITYTADGVLVATATGSTAYSLAAGGPIMYPESTDIVITPVAPHLHIGRSTIVRGDTAIRLTLQSGRPGVISVDSLDERALELHDSVEVCRSAIVARFARLGPRWYFYSAIADRLR